MRRVMGWMASAVLCALPFFATPSNAAPLTPDAPREIEIPYVKQVLPNGLTLIVHEDHDAPVVSLSVWYHVGSKNERPGRTGFAHLFEHLMFVGSEHHDDEHFRPLRAAGGTDVGGITLRDVTIYYQVVPTGALDLALWLESDRMANFLGVADRQKKLDTQRGVVQNEQRQYGNLPYGKVDGIIAAHTYPVGHPYSWEVFGSIEDLNAVTLDDVSDWVRSYQGAANAVVVMAGDISVAHARERVEHYFGGIPSGPPVIREKLSTAKMTGVKRVVVQDYAPQPRVYRIWNIPGYATRDYSLLKLVADMLGGDKTGRLFRRLVEKDHLATAVQAEVTQFEIASQLRISVTLAPGGDVAAVDRAVDEEVAGFLRTGPSTEELARIKAAARARFLRGIEYLDGSKNQSRTAVLALGELYAGSPDLYKRSLAWVREATATDVQLVAQRWLSDGVFVLDVQPLPERQVSANKVDRSRLPAVDAPPPLRLPPLQRTTLSNGLAVALVERHGAPVVDLTLVVDAGSAADVLASPGTAALAIDMLDEGTRKRDALQLAERAEALGARFQTSSSLDASLIKLSALAESLDDSLELFGDMIVEPAFPQRALERLKGERVAAIRQEKSDPRNVALRLLPRLMYGEGHAYSGPFSGTGTESAIAALSRDDIEKFYRNWIRPDNATLLVVGDVKLARLERMLESRLSSWKVTAGPRPRKAISSVAPPTTARVFLVDRPGAAQSMIVAGRPAPARADENFVPFVAANSVFGGSFLSRLNMNLREQKHWAYVVGSRVTGARGAGAFFMEAPIQTDKTADAMREMVKELRDIGSARPVTAGELHAAQDTLVLALPGPNAAIAALSSAYADVIANRLADDSLNGYVARVDALTPSTVQPAAAMLARPETLTWVVLGDLARIESAVRALDLGSVKVIDADGNVLR